MTSVVAIRGTATPAEYGIAGTVEWASITEARTETDNLSNRRPGRHVWHVQEEAVIADGPISRIEWVEEQLRTALLNGELAPGERLLTAQLSERFQVSPTPLREALHRFAGEGLVEFIPQRGARVAELSVDDSRELTELRALLEPVCVTHALKHPSGEWVAAVTATADELTSALCSRKHFVATSENAYRAFYAALTSTCDSARLRRYATSVRDQHARYRAATLDSLDRRTLAAVVGNLATAALGGKAKPAAAAVRAEVELFADAYAELVPQ